MQIYVSTCRHGDYICFQRQMEASEIFSLALTRPTSDSNGKKQEMDLNGISIYCWTVKVAQKSVQLLDFTVEKN